MKSNGERGAALLVTLVLFTAMMLIALPLMTRLLRQNSRMAVKTKHGKVAYQLASAGIDRAVWKLKETGQNWRDILSTGPLAGYDNDVNYTDVNLDDGVYRVRISSTPDEDLFIVTATGKDGKSREYATIEARVRRTQIAGPLHAYNLAPSSGITGLRVHWGPIYDHGALTLTHNLMNQLYPRKFAAASIAVSSGVYGDRDLSPNSPNTDNSEYYAYHQVPPLITPDFDFYRASAAAIGEYYGGNKTFDPAQVDSAPTVRFIEGNVTFKRANKFIWGTVIALGNCTLKGNNAGGPGNYAATPPHGAWDEYRENVPLRYDQTGAFAFGDTAAVDEYAGDTGLASTGTYVFGTPAPGVVGKRISFRGVLYCGGNLIAATNPANAQAIHGAVILGKDSQIQGHVEIFHDPSWKLVTSSIGVYVDERRRIKPDVF